MPLDAGITLVVVAAVVAAMARGALPPPAAMLGGVVVLLLAGVITPEAAFRGFANPAPITVAALYVVARAVQHVGLLGSATSALLDGARSRAAQVARVVLPAAATSSVLNNTPVVAVAAPQVTDWAQRRGLPPSRLLIPLSYAAILGGTLTVVGTSTNLVVSGLLEEAGQPPIGMFELTTVTLPVVAVCCLVMIVLAGKLLPDRRGARAEFERSVREFNVAMRVVPGGALDGQSIADAGLRHLDGVYCVQVDRGGRQIAPVAPTEVLLGDDVLTFVGKVDDVVDLQRLRGLESTESHHLQRLNGGGHRFYEVVVGPQSPLAGATLRQVGFRGHYQAAVLALHRSGQRLDAKPGEVRLRLGDTLLVVADEGFADRWRSSRDFLLVAEHAGAPPARSGHALLVGALVAGMVAAAGTGLVPVLHAAVATALLVVVTGVLTVRQAREAIDLDVVVTIAAAFGVGAAMAASGLAAQVADGLVDLLGPLGTVGALAGVVLATLVLTEVVTNNAAAVLVFPIAVATASAVGAEPRLFALSVAVAASLSFLTPIGYQTNLMVYGLGGYRFTDYARLGAPLALIAAVLVLVLGPRVWG